MCRKCKSWIEVSNTFYQPDGPIGKFFEMEDEIK